MSQNPMFKYACDLNWRSFYQHQNLVQSRCCVLRKNVVIDVDGFLIRTHDV